MKDRVVEHPARYQLVPVAGIADQYDFVPVPGMVTEEGDDVNKANLLPDAVKTALNLAQTNPQVADALEKLSNAALRKTTGHTATRTSKTIQEAFNSTIGNTITLDGIVYRYIASNYLASNSVMLQPTVPLNYGTFGANTTYSGSNVDTYCNSTFINALNSALSAQILSVTIASQGSTLSRKCFALSATELNCGYVYPNEGTAIPYFDSDSKRSATSNYWTRSIYGLDTTSINVVQANGTAGAILPSASAHLRPTFVLPNSATVYLDADGKYYSEQGYTPYVYTLTDMSDNEFVLPYAKIVTGSYTGTGTFGFSNPISLTFGFTPKFVIVWPSGSTFSGTPTATPLIAINNAPYPAMLVLGDSSYHYCILTWNTTTLSWYSGNTAVQQMNSSTTTYYYAAIG